MTQVKDNINSRTGKHLTYEERRVKIEGYKALGYSNRAIARILKRAPQKNNNAVHCGTVRTNKQRQILNDNVYEYDQYNYSAEADYQMYLRNRQNCGRRPKWLACDPFTNWADNKMLQKDWSPDMVVGRATKKYLYKRTYPFYIDTFYYWIDRRIMRTKNIDLFEKISRKSPSTRRFN